MEVEQHMVALERANEVRLATAAFKRQLKEGEVDPRDVLADVPDLVRKTKVYDFLTWCPRIGRERAWAILRSNPNHPIGPSLPLGRLSERTRLRLAAQLPVTAAMRRPA